MLVVAGSDPIIRSEDTDTANTYAEFKQIAGSLFIDSRNDSSDGTIVFRGVGGGSATEKLTINSSGQTIVNGVDDQDNFVVDVANSEFEKTYRCYQHGEISLRAQDGSGNSNDFI